MIFNNYYPQVSEYCGIIKPKENNCFSIIAQVIIRATALSFISFTWFFFSVKTSRNRAVPILKISASVL